MSTNDEPLKGVTVTLALSEDVYWAIDPVNRVSQLTDFAGHYEFSYISGTEDLKYSVQFSKDSYDAITISASGLPEKPLNVVLSPVAPIRQN